MSEQDPEAYLSGPESPVADDGTEQANWDDQDGTTPLSDVPEGVTEFGTTPEEEREGESLDLRLSREQPDRPERPADDHAGRLVDPDEGAHEDNEADLIGEDRGHGEGGYTAEEAAMHIEGEGGVSR
jgi:hypothetical protein